MRTPLQILLLLPLALLPGVSGAGVDGDATALRGEVSYRLDQWTPADGFDVDALARELGQSRRTLYRKLEPDGQSPAELILHRRLDRAAELLAGREGNVSEVAYAVGFRSVSHFSRRFRERHGKSPSRVRARS